MSFSERFQYVKTELHAFSGHIGRNLHVMHKL